MDITLSLLPYQRQMLSSDSPFTFAVMGRGSGKSYTLSIIALLALLQGKDVILCAQRYDSLRDVVMREVKARVYEWGLQDVISFKENPIRCSFGDSTIFCGSYEGLEGLRGLTNISLILLDEVALAPLYVLDVLAPCMRGPKVEHPRIMGATTPRLESLWNIRFAEAYKYGWKIIQASTYDNKFLTEEQIRIIEAAMQSDTMRRQELCAEIITNATSNSIITLDKFRPVPAECLDDRIIAGLDMAHGVERDCHALFIRQGNRVLDMKKWNDVDGPFVAQYIRNFNKTRKINQLNIDLAWSEYVYETLKYEIPCRQVAFAEAASEQNRQLYANIRAEMYFNLAWQAEHGLCLEYADTGMTAELKRQLCSTTWKKTSNGRLILLPKEDLKELIGCSPDIADAAALTCIDRWGDVPAIKTVSGTAIQELRRKARNMMG